MFWNVMLSTSIDSELSFELNLSRKKTSYNNKVLAKKLNCLHAAFGVRKPKN